MDACRNYPGASNARRITFEYVMLDGVNDTVAHARELMRLVSPVPCTMSRLPFSPSANEIAESCRYTSGSAFGMLNWHFSGYDRRKHDAGQVGYIPLPDDAYQLAQERVQKKVTGSVFAGGSQVGVSIQDLLKKESGAAE